MTVRRALAAFGPLYVLATLAAVLYLNHRDRAAGARAVPPPAVQEASLIGYGGPR